MKIEFGYIPYGSGSLHIDWFKPEDGERETGHGGTVMVGGNGIGKAKTYDEAIQVATEYIKDKFADDREKADRVFRKSCMALETLEKHGLFGLMRKS